MPQQAISSKPPMDASWQNLVVRDTLVAERVVASSIATDILNVNRIQIGGVPFDPNAASASTAATTTTPSEYEKVPGVVNSIVTLTGTGGLQSSGLSTLVNGVLDLSSATAQLQINSSPVIKVNPSQTSVALGVNAGGADADASARNVTVGTDAGSTLTTGSDNVVVGFQATIADTTATQNVVVGANARAGNSQSIAIGANSNSGDGINLVLGFNSKCEGNFTSSNNLVIGSNSKIDSASGAMNSIMIGNNITQLSIGRSVSIGTDSSAFNLSVSIGDSAITALNNSVSIGANAKCSGARSVAVGRDSECQGADCLSIGRLSVIGNATNCIAVGNNSSIADGSTNCIVVGTNSLITNPLARCIVLGSDLTAVTGDDDTLVLDVEHILGAPPNAVTDSLQIRVGTDVFYVALAPT